jgi:hypothetical protein
MTAEYGPFARRTFTSSSFADEAKPSRPAEPRSFAAEDTLGAPGAGETMFPAEPIYARSTRKKDAGSIIPKAAAIAVPALLLAAGAIYLMARPAPDGLFAESSAGAAPPAAMTQPAAPMAPEAPVVQQASAPAPAQPASIQAAPRSQTTQARPVQTRRAAAPATLASADNPQNWARGASATLPTAPIPYSAIAQGSAPAGAPLLVTPEPVPEAATATPVPATPDPATASTPAPTPEESTAEPTP